MGREVSGQKPSRKALLEKVPDTPVVQCTLEAMLTPMAMSSPPAQSHVCPVSCVGEHQYFDHIELRVLLVEH